jgi:nitrite reductase/ring-hydroxylating ferredoxin subunit
MSTSTNPSFEPRFWHELPHAPEPGALVGTRDALVDGQATLHTIDTGAGPDSPFRMLLLRSGSKVTAFANRCAHFGVPLSATQEHMQYTPHIRIICNVHYARYRWADGTCESGDCDGEGLIPIPLTVDAQGQIRIAPIQAA